MLSWPSISRMPTFQAASKASSPTPAKAEGRGAALPNATFPQWARDRTALSRFARLSTERKSRDAAWVGSDRPTIRSIIQTLSTCLATNDSFWRRLQLRRPDRSLQRIVFGAESDLAEMHVVRRVEQPAPNPTVPHEDLYDLRLGVEQPQRRTIAVSICPGGRPPRAEIVIRVCHRVQVDRNAIGVRAENFGIVLGRTTVEAYGVVARFGFRDREIFVRLHAFDREVSRKEFAEDLDRFLGQSAVDDEHAIMHRIVKADIVEMDGNQIVERHGAAIMPGPPVHLLSLIRRESLDACLKCLGLLGLHGGQRREADGQEQQRSHVHSLPLRANGAGVSQTLSG